MFHPPYAGESLWSRGDVYLDRVVAEVCCRLCGDRAESVVIREEEKRAATQSEYPLCESHAGVGPKRRFNRT